MQRADTGVYTVTAKNSSGTDQVEVEISVLSMFNKLIFLVKFLTDGCDVHIRA